MKFWTTGDSIKKIKEKYHKCYVGVVFNVDAYFKITSDHFGNKQTVVFSALNLTVSTSKDYPLMRLQEEDLSNLANKASFESYYYYYY